MGEKRKSPLPFLIVWGEVVHLLTHTHTHTHTHTLDLTPVSELVSQGRGKVVRWNAFFGDEKEGWDVIFVCKCVCPFDDFVANHPFQDSFSTHLWADREK